MAVDFDHGLFRDLGDPVVLAPVKASATWDAGDLLKSDAGYLVECGAGDIPYGVAVATLVAADSPSSSGDVSALVYVGANNHYKLKSDGTAAITMIGQVCDVGANSTADIDAATDKSLRIIEVDTDANTVIVTLNPALSAGVV